MTGACMKHALSFLYSLTWKNSVDKSVKMNEKT